MIRLTWRHLVGGLCLICVTSTVDAQTFTGSNLSHKSSGSGSGSWSLDENGYVGTYISLASPGEVTLTVNASGSTDDAVAPRMNVVIADTQAGFDVANGFGNYQHTFDLPAGTYFVRTEFNNDVPGANRQLTVGNLTISGATSVSNTSSTTANNANALAAADTYIENYRQGPSRVALSGVAPGTQAHVQLKRHDFRFGTAVGGTFVGGGGNQYDVNTYLNNSNYSQFLLDNFNAITPGNAGKWAYNEANRDSVNMAAVDRLLDFADQNGLDVRMHNLIWGQNNPNNSQQPGWVVSMLNDALGGNAAAKTQLRDEISERIDYYVGNGDDNQSDDRSRRIVELDVLNEHDHVPAYWNLYGADGIAEVFSEVAEAVEAADADTKLFLNEYNVLQFGADSYGNWYRRDVEQLNQLGGAVSGIGVQYYPFSVGGSNAHSAARMNQIFQNFSVTGMPISLTEFGVQTNNGTTVEEAATYLTESIRVVFGSPNATSFVNWGFWANDVWDQAPLAALMDANWNLTLAGEAFLALMAEWDTDLTLEVGPDGTIDFTGFYGDYEITIGNQTFSLDLHKGTQQYSLVVAPGDYNGDGTVDAGDYTVWRDAMGSTNDLRADGNGDGMIDEADYGVWKSRFGTSYASGQASVAVPEPASTVLLMLGSVMLTSRRLRNL